MLLFQSEFQARKTERGSLPLHQEPVVLRLQVSERSSLGPTVPGQEARISACREEMRFWRLRLVPAPPQIQSLHDPADPGTYSILSFGAVHSRQVPTLVCRRVCAAARLAQSVEHETLNLRVVGSSPTLGVVFAAYCGFLPHVGWSSAPSCPFPTKRCPVGGTGCRHTQISDLH